MILMAMLVLMMAMLRESIVVGCPLHTVVDADATPIGCHQTIRHRRIVPSVHVTATEVLGLLL